MKSLLLTCFLVVLVLVNQSIQNPVEAEDDQLQTSTEEMSTTTR